MLCQMKSFIPQCTTSFITTPKPFSQWSMGNEGRYMLRHVDGQTSLLHYSQMLHIAGMLFSFHNICRLHIIPKDPQEWMSPHHRLSLLSWPLYGLQMSFRWRIYFSSVGLFKGFDFTNVKKTPKLFTKIKNSQNEIKVHHAPNKTKKLSKNKK